MRRGPKKRRHMEREVQDLVTAMHFNSRMREIAAEIPTAGERIDEWVRWSA